MAETLAKFVGTRVYSDNEHGGIGVSTGFLQQSSQVPLILVSSLNVKREDNENHLAMGRSLPNFATVSVNAILGDRNLSSGSKSTVLERK